jgi:hypothetical protein
MENNASGDVSFLDIGDVVVIVPGGIERLRSEMIEAITPEIWEAARAGFGDDELATQ